MAIDAPPASISTTMWSELAFTLGFVYTLVSNERGVTEREEELRNEKDEEEAVEERSG